MGFENIFFKKLKKDVDLQHVFIDSTIVRAHSYSTGKNIKNQSVSRSFGGFSTTIYAACNGFRYLLKLMVTARQAHEVNQIQPVLKNISERKTVAIDRTYHTDFVMNFLHQQN